MPLPKTKNVGTVISFLKKEKPNMPKKQKIAIALAQTGKSKKKKYEKSKYTKDQIAKAVKKKFARR